MIVARDSWEVGPIAEGDVMMVLRAVSQEFTRSVFMLEVMHRGTVIRISAGTQDVGLISGASRLIPGD